MTDFTQSRKLTWFVLLLIAAQTIGIAVVPDPNVAGVFTTAIMIEGGLVAAWTGITNWRETK